MLSIESNVAEAFCPPTTTALVPFVAMSKAFLILVRSPKSVPSSVDVMLKYSTVFTRPLLFAPPAKSARELFPQPPKLDPACRLPPVEAFPVDEKVI